MDAPRFNGSDAPNWISRVQYYFDHLMMSDAHRLHYVVMLFDPPAADWIFNYRANNNVVQWNDFLEDVHRRFDPQCFQNFIGLIAKLCQTGTLASYNVEFEAMLNRVRGMPEYILLPIYIEGLQQPVKTQVKHQHPASLAAAMALAVEYDSCLERPQPTSGFQRHTWSNRDAGGARQPQPQPTAAPQSGIPPDRQPSTKGPEYSKLPVIRLSRVEKAERTRKGLCWYCPEKYEPNHVCKKTFLAYMGVDDDSEDGEGEPAADQPDSEIITTDISHIYALEGHKRSDAIELMDTIGDTSVLILVDTGSSHDFLHPRVAEKLALPLKAVKPF